MFGLFGSGLKDRANHFHPAEFVFPLSAALRDLDPATLEIIFVPVSGLERGQGAEALRSRVPVRVGEVAIIIDAQMPQPPRDEQERLRREDEAR